jgi:hypothetical protein
MTNPEKDDDMMELKPITNNEKEASQEEKVVVRDKSQQDSGDNPLDKIAYEE